VLICTGFSYCPLDFSCRLWYVLMVCGNISRHMPEVERRCAGEGLAPVGGCANTRLQQLRREPLGGTDR
jgi:hypothetical protein